MPHSFLAELINIPSITGQEAEISKFLQKRLQANGWEVFVQLVSGNRYNIYATSGEPEIVFSTHMDTVPPYIQFSEDDNYIYGRGACDAKGCLAVQIAAAEQLRKSGISTGLLFVVGEERGSDGAKAANLIPNKSAFLINGEPTENILASGTKGVLRLRITTTGKAAHSAYPELGESAILKLLVILAEIEAANWPADSIIGATTVNIGKIGGGIAGNVIPFAAEAEIMFRTAVETSLIKNLFTSLINRRAEIEILYSCNPIKLEVPAGFVAKPVSFATDITSLTNWGNPLLLGPGSIHDAHTSEEKVAKKDLEEAVKLYVQISRKLLQ